MTQRFCIAILQKCSIKDTVIPTYVENDMIFWVIKLIKKSLTAKIHVFCLDFASAMLANVIHTPCTIGFLEHNPKIASEVAPYPFLISSLGDGELAEIDPGEHSSVCADAHSYRPVLP